MAKLRLKLKLLNIRRFHKSHMLTISILCLFPANLCIRLNLNLHRFMVRDFTYNEKDIADGKMEISKLEDDKKKQYVSSTANGNYMLIDGFLHG